MREVIIFFKQQCHLCHVALRIARHIQMDTSFTLHAIDITEDVSLLAQYGTRIPVILIDQRERFAGKVTERELRTALKKARWSTSISRILSRLGLRLNRDDHFSGTPVTPHFVQPTRGPAVGTTVEERHRCPLLLSSYLALLRVGFAEPAGHPAAGELLPHRFTLTPPRRRSLRRGHRRFVFCGTVPRVAPPGRYPAPCPVESGLSSRACTRAII